MNNKKLIIGVIVGIVVLAVVAFFVFGKSNKIEEQVSTIIEDEIVVMKAEEIGLTLSASEDNRELIVEVAKTEGISSLDYELEYTAKGDLPRGAIGRIDIEQEGEPASEKITLGTCSDVCHYDEDVSNIKLTVRVTKADGSVGEVIETLDL